MTFTHKSVAAALLVAATLGMAGCGGDTGKDIASDDSSTPTSSAPAAPTAFDVSGTISLVGEGYGGGQPCSGDGGYADMRAGTQVTVYNAAAQPVGLGALLNGTSKGGDCVFSFSIPQVPVQPGGSDIYSVEVSHRGQINFTQETANQLAFSLGD